MKTRTIQSDSTSHIAGASDPGHGSLRFILPLLGSLLLTCGCSRIVSHYTSPLLTDLTQSLMSQKDVVMAEQGTPAFLLLLDGLIAHSPQDKDLLLAGAQAYSAYNTAFVGERAKDRSKLIAERAKDYGMRALLAHCPRFAKIKDQRMPEFSAFLGGLGPRDVPYLFHAASSWLGWIQANADSFDAIADLAKVQRMLERVIELDETFYYGTAHTMLAALLTVNPPSLGGKPEQARVHFERALEISGGQFFPIYVLYAERYAKLVYNEELYFTLLQKVVDTPVDAVADLTLINVLAQQQALTLMTTTRADAYFE